MLYLCRVKPLRHYLRGFLIAAWAGDKIAEFSFPEISFHFSLRPWFFFVSPAYAGKRGCRTLEWPDCRDHPRVCGEKGCCKFSSRNHSGSPPRMRGKGPAMSPGHITCGITPAYAGKSAGRRGVVHALGDHPRVCGEKSPLPDPERIFQGSPPRMRGKGHVFFQLFPAHRITPAYAGKRALHRKHHCQCQDHPRVCGEKAVDRIRARSIKGSPPRMRGKVVG